MGTRKRKNDDAVETDTDPIGKPKRKGKPKKNEQQLADLILEGRSEDVRIVTVHADPPKKKRRWLKWGLIGFGVLWVMSLFAPPKDKATPPAQVEQVAIRPTNTVQPTITPVSRATLTAQALIALDTAKTQTAPTQTPIVEYVVVTATSSATDIPTETAIPSDVPLPSATPITSNLAVVMVTNTPIPSATATNTDTPTITVTASATVTNTPTSTNTPLPSSTATPSVRVLERNGIVTYDYVNVRSCASSTCNQLGRLLKNATFEITGTMDGENVTGSVLWYQIDYQGQVGYVHSSLVAIYTGQPPVNNVSVPAQPVSPVQPVAPISLAPAGGWNCNGEQYDCPQFGARGQYSCPQLQEYWRVCVGDPSNLDGNPKDGFPCESQCPSNTYP